MTLADRVRAVSLSRLKITIPRDTPMISGLSLKNTSSQDLLSVDGASDPHTVSTTPDYVFDLDLYIGALGVTSAPIPSSDFGV